MKKKYFLTFLIIFLIIFSVNVKADSYYIVLNDTVKIRKGPGTTYTKIGLGSNGASFNLLDKNIIPDEVKDGTCDAGWYKIDYKGEAAFLCSEYATFYQEIETKPEIDNSEAKTECELALKNAGFPSSYWNDLCTLQIKYPKWKFIALNTGLDFKTVVEKESVCGKSYIATSKEDYIDKTCKNQYTSTWYPASQKAVAYYLDPRNWLNEKNIFQFEYLKYESSLSENYVSSANAIIQNAAFYKHHKNLGIDLGSIINDAGNQTNVSPAFLASRMLQELGTSTKLYNLYSGLYENHDKAYYGYYNFFNYGVTDSCATTNGTSICGLEYARKNGWNSPLNAIKGASSSLSSSYISKGQYTTYLQKFNVVPTDLSKLYIHQYQTNIAAPASEGSITYNSYKKLNALDNAYVFYIPIYNNLDSTINNSNNGAVEDTEEEKPTGYEVSEIVKLAGYEYSDKYIKKIGVNSKVVDVKGSLESISGTSIKILDSKGNVVTDGIIGTGFIISISNGSNRENLTVVIKGDTSGDGIINALDLLQVQKSILGTYKLEEPSLLAGDTSNDNEINALDLLQIQKNILGTYEIGK